MSQIVLANMADAAVLRYFCMMQLIVRCCHLFVLLTRQEKRRSLR